MQNALLEFHSVQATQRYCLQRKIIEVDHSLSDEQYKCLIYSGGDLNGQKGMIKSCTPHP